jgi:SET domain-containing protein
MLKVKIKNSGIHGLGLFADKFIPKGTIVWKRDFVLDISIPKKEVVYFDEVEKNSILHYSYLDFNDNYVLCADDARFMNHSDNPNLESQLISGDPLSDISNWADIASKDIEIGEEITCDYTKFDLDSKEKLKR